MKFSASCPVKGALCGRLNGNRKCRFLHLQSFSKENKFWQGVKKVQSLVQSAFFQAVLYTLGQSKSFGMCAKCHVIELAAAIVFSHPGRLWGKMMTPGKSSQVYLAFSLRLLVRETMGVLDTKMLHSLSLPSLHLVERQLSQCGQIY